MIGIREMKGLFGLGIMVTVEIFHLTGKYVVRSIALQI